MFWCVAFIVGVCLVISVIAWWTNPKRRWNIDRNVRTIVSSKVDMEILIFSESNDLFREYCWQLKGYRNVSCRKEPGEPYIIVLTKSFGNNMPNQAKS